MRTPFSIPAKHQQRHHPQIATWIPGKKIESDIASYLRQAHDEVQLCTMVQPTPASRYLFWYLLGYASKLPVVQPATVDDLRAIRLVLALPHLVGGVSCMREVGGAWKALADNWAELTVLMDFEASGMAHDSALAACLERKLNSGHDPALARQQ
ncbi:MAG: hypothetical protein ACK50G_00700 [bacterium]